MESRKGTSQGGRGCGTWSARRVQVTVQGGRGCGTLSAGRVQVTVQGGRGVAL